MRLVRFHRGGASAARALLVLGVFLYLVLVRTSGISRSFWLLGDQILYWRIALGSWRDLPIGGGPSSVGGTTLGPTFVWTLWAIRHLVGPWTDNLPHAGGIGLSIVQSAADAFLAAAVWKRFGSPAMAVALALFVGSAPFDMALTATIWNPPLAVAFVKISIAAILFSRADGPLWWEAAATAAALCAVQTHSSAIFFAAPAIASLVARRAIADGVKAGLRRAAALAAVMLALELPFVVNRLVHAGDQAAPVLVVRSVAYTLAHPDALRPAQSFAAVVSSCEYILLLPWTFAWGGTAIVVCAAVAILRLRRDVTLVSVTVAPIVVAIAGFSFWQRAFDSYWFMTIAPSVALTVVLAATAWRPAAPIVSAVLLAATVAAQPSRLAEAHVFFRLPEYGLLARGSQLIRRRLTEVRGIATEFTLPNSTDPTFLYEVLGGRVTAGAPFSATIRADGQVTFTDTREPPTAGKGN